MIKLLPLDALANGDSKEFEINGLKLFLTKKAGEIYAYKNRCPHQGISLNWQADVFLDFDKQLIQCATHGARFIIETGKCVAGPCLGATLDKIPVVVKDSAIYISDFVVEGCSDNTGSR